MSLEVIQIFDDLLRYQKEINELVEIDYTSNLQAEKEKQRWLRLLDFVSLYENQKLLQLMIFLQTQIFRLHQELLQSYQRMSIAILNVFNSLLDSSDRLVRIPELGIDLDQHAMIRQIGHNIAEAARRGEDINQSMVRREVYEHLSSIEEFAKAPNVLDIYVNKYDNWFGSKINSSKEILAEINTKIEIKNTLASCYKDLHPKRSVSGDLRQISC